MDIIFERNRTLVPIEIKSASTFHTSFSKGLKKFQKLSEKAVRGFVIYSGEFAPQSDAYSVVHFRNTSSIFKESLNDG